MRDAMLIIHFLGLAMGVGTSLAFLFLGLASAKMEKSAANNFMLNALSLSKMGNIGLLLLFLSGGYLMTPYWSSLTSMPLLIAKLTLFLILAALLGIMSGKTRRIKQNYSEEEMNKLSKMGKLTLPIAITIIILAVLVFH